MFFRFPTRFYFAVRVLVIALAGTTLVLPARAQITTLPAPVNASGLRLQLDNEEPTFVYSERETLRTQTPIAWGLRAWNDLNLERKITLSWRVRDAFGHTLASDKEKLTLPANGMIRRRELFQPKTLGAYRIDVESRAARKGEDDVVRATFSFAVVAPPAPFTTATSPLSSPFFELSSRAPRAAEEDDFLNRVGANQPSQSSGALPADMTMTLPYPQLSDASDDEQGTGEGANWNRTLLAAQKATPVFSVRNDVVAGNSAIRAASSLVKCSVLAKSAGAASVRSLLPSPLSDADTRLTCAAAWSQMARLLEGATGEGTLYPGSPVVQSASFRIASSRIVVLWSDGDNNSSTRLETRLAGARVLDIFGNEIARSDKDRLVVPLSSNPVYVLADVSPKQSRDAWGNATLKSLPAIGVQVLPFTRLIPNGAAPRNLALRVRVQNIGIAPFQGTFRVGAPKNWLLANDRTDLVLAPGETRVLSFPVLTSAANASGVYPIETEAKSDAGRWKRKQDARVATIPRVADGAINVDGTLNEWDNASWMEASSPDEKSGVRAQVALFFDDDNLYVAARVRENAFQARPATTNEYLFWQNSDALQLAFGMRSEGDALPSAGAFRDTDYGVLLSPFATSSEGQVVGRALRLWSPQSGFETATDRVNWGGDISGARCVVTRDERNKITFYEASIPLSQIPDLRPQHRMQIDQTVRFTWIYHSSDAAVVSNSTDNVFGENALEWSRVTNVFPWWRNTGSMMPSKNLYLAAQVPVGFMPRSIDLPQIQPPIATPTPTFIPQSTPQPQPTPRAPISSTPTPQPTPSQVLPPLPLPPSPDAQLPPAAPSVRNDPLPNLPQSPVQ